MAGSYQSPPPPPYQQPYHHQPTGYLPPPRRHKRRGIALLAVLAACVMVLAIVVAVRVLRPGDDGPDPFAGAYPIAPPVPVGNVPTWKPRKPAGQLPKFRGTKSKLRGRRVQDTESGLSYAMFGKPWVGYKKQGSNRSVSYIQRYGKAPKKITLGSIDSFVIVKSSTLDPRLAFTAKGENAARMAAELKQDDDATSLLVPPKTRRKDIAGAPLTVDSRKGWVSAMRLFYPPKRGQKVKSQTFIVVAVDTGRSVPAVLEMKVPDIHKKVLPDANTLVDSLRVI